MWIFCAIFHLSLTIDSDQNQSKAHFGMPIVQHHPTTYKWFRNALPDLMNSVKMIPIPLQNFAYLVLASKSFSLLI